MSGHTSVKSIELSIREDVSDHESKKYNKEFKQTVVELYRSGTPVNQLASEYGVSEVTIYKWIKIHSPIEGTGGVNCS
ncbi:transposase [Lysinibacillus sp. RC79]|uniref:transposase n=1 Tax=Lysinibacillus sp. RC79 TaxID=3156296 RepID=UPI0035197C5E